jgi:hypothetical protein
MYNKIIYYLKWLREQHHCKDLLNHQLIPIQAHLQAQALKDGWMDAMLMIPLYIV